MEEPQASEEVTASPSTCTPLMVSPYGPSGGPMKPPLTLEELPPKTLPLTTKKLSIPLAMILLPRTKTTPTKT